MILQNEFGSIKIPISPTDDIMSGVVCYPHGWGHKNSYLSYANQHSGENINVLTNSSKKAEVTLLFADKRVKMSQILFEKEKPEIAFATLLKAEQYLFEASKLEEENRKKGVDTLEFARVMTYASLKHIQVLHDVLNLAPEDARPEIIELIKIPTETYNKNMHVLNEKGIEAPDNPF